MAPSNFGYSLREAGHHFVRNGSSTFGAVITIFLSLFIIGLFAMGSVLLDGMVGTVEDQVTIQAFLSDDASQDAVDALQSKISGWSEVESVSYKSKDEALAEYRETMTQRNASDAVAALDDRNPIPASIVIKLHDPQDVEGVAKRLGSDDDFAAVADVTTAEDGCWRSPLRRCPAGCLRSPLCCRVHHCRESHCRQTAPLRPLPEKAAEALPAEFCLHRPFCGLRVYRCVPYAPSFFQFSSIRRR